MASAYELLMYDSLVPADLNRIVWSIAVIRGVAVWKAESVYGRRSQ